MSSNMLEEPVGKFIHKKIVMLESDQTVEKAAKTMRDEQIGSILVSEKGEVTGIVTERDILYKVVAGGKDSSRLKLKDIMSKPLVFIDSSSKVKEAIALMAKNNIRRLVVREDKKVIGVISQRAVVGDLHKMDISIAEIDVPKGVLCPYCGSTFSNKEELSKHIDRMHIGAGLLEGDVRQF
ncbi:MAG: CBS domain-containing protein [Nitrososphaerales archaeon]